MAGGFFYWNYLRGNWSSILPPEKNITQIIEDSKNTKPSENKTKMPIKLPDGFSISIYAKELTGARDLNVTPNGEVIVSLTSEGKVVVIKESENKIILSGLNRPHGIAFSGNTLYVAETNGVSTFDYNAVTNTASNKKKIIDLPANGSHFTRSLLIRNNKLFISIGSDCNACVEDDKRRAAIWSANLDGSDFKSYAQGLRNSVFMTLHPTTNEIWATDMGRDFLGDNLPPEEVNIIKENGFYGWPYCYSNKVHDNSFDTKNSFDCNQSIKPEVEMQAHSAPLGLAFYKGNLLVSFHGSWNRTTPTGYKVVRIQNGKVEDFITGWISNGQVLGRPVDILTQNDNIYISDDKAGVIYLVRPI